MGQNSYNTIIACIQFGAPALAQQLMDDLNQVINNSNAYIQAQRDAAEKAKQEEAAKNTNKGSTPGTPGNGTIKK